MFFKKLFNSDTKDIKKNNGDSLIKEAISDYENDKDEYEVIKKINKAIELGIENYTLDKVYLYLGLAYKDIGEIEKAIETLEKGSGLNPKNSKIITNLGSLYSEVGKAEKAYQLYYDALLLIPENATLYNNIGAYYYECGNHIKALEYYDVALKFNSMLTTTYANKARSLAHIGKYEEANKFAKIAKLRDYDAYTQLMTDIQDIKVNNPSIYFDRNKYIEFAIQISDNCTEILNTLFNIIDYPLDFYKQNENELIDKLYTSFEIINSLQIFYLIDYLNSINKIVVFDNSENIQNIIQRIEVLVNSQIYIEDGFFDEFFANKNDYSISALLTAMAAKLKIIRKYEILDIWSNEYNYNIVLLDSDKWEKLDYPHTNDVYGVGVIRNFATDEIVNTYISKDI